MKCKICNKQTENIFKKIILSKYEAQYYKCPSCGFIQTEKPYWLDESYSDAITSLDLGLINRNIEMSNLLDDIFHTHNIEEKYLDFAGGYGMLVRIMRDKGYDFYREDKYCENLFAKYFDYNDLAVDSIIKAITAFEVIEHLEFPLNEFTDIFNRTDSLVFSTTLYPEKEKELEDWWYLSPEIGQHISFYSKRTLEFISKKFNKTLISNEIDVHIMTTDEDLIEYKFPYKKNENIINKYRKKIRRKLGLSKKEFARKSFINDDYKKVKEILFA